MFWVFNPSLGGLHPGRSSGQFVRLRIQAPGSGPDLLVARFMSVTQAISSSCRGSQNTKASVLAVVPSTCVQLTCQAISHNNARSTHKWRDELQSTCAPVVAKLITLTNWYRLHDQNWLSFHARSQELENVFRDRFAYGSFRRYFVLRNGLRVISTLAPWLLWDPIERIKRFWV